MGNPISLAFGNKYEEITDYQTAGMNPLAFARYYNSLGNTNSRATVLGSKWRSTYDRYLRIISTNGVASVVVAERADGQELVFTANGTNWTPDTDVDLKLTRDGGFWTLSDPNDTVETYASGATSTGVLTTIQYRNGYTQFLLYDSGLLSSVSDSFDRSLNFAYQGGLLHSVTTPSGLVVTFGYNVSAAAPRLDAATYSTFPATSQQYVYEDAGNPFGLTGLIDENGNRYATWTYDSRGRATSSSHSNGADLTTVTYNDSDGSRVVTNALEGVSIYKFQTLQNIPKIIEIDRLATAPVPAASRTFSYDGNGYLTFESDWNMNVVSRVNDVHGQPTTVTEAASTPIARLTTAQYLTNFHLPFQIAIPGKTTSIGYDGNGNPLTITQTDTSSGTAPYSTTGRTRSWTNIFDNVGHIRSVTGPRTDMTATTHFGYDATNNLVAITNAMGQVTLLTNYTGSGLPLTMIDPNHVVTSFTYDSRDRLLTSTVHAASGNASTTFAYDAVGQVATVTLPDGSFLAYQYDAAHRLVKVTNALGESINYLRDTAGDITNQTVRDSGGVLVKTENYLFDWLGRVRAKIGASSQTTIYEYDANGNRTTKVDALHTETVQAFDALNRLVEVVNDVPTPVVFSDSPQVSSYYKTSLFGFDAQDNLISFTDPRTLVTSYVRDGFGRIIQETSLDKGTTTYQLDQSGNRTNEVDARGIVTVRTFDKLNRVTSQTFPASPGENITYSYDSTNGRNFGIGRLTGYTDETGNATLTYNERGDAVSETRAIGGKAYTTAYGYDLADHVISITYPSGHTVTYARDSQGRIGSVSYSPSVSGMPTMLANYVTYAPFGPLTGLLYGNGLTRTQGYDQDYRLTEITTAGGATIQNLSLNYDAVNDITAITDNLASAINQHFTYDSDYRLIDATGIYGNTAYSYDPDGNRLTRTAGGVTENYNYSTTANMLQSVVKSGVTRSFGYTANGNLSSDNRGMATNLVFAYNNRNRYNALTIGGNLIASYKYNALGERLIKTANGMTTHFQYDRNGHLIAETQPDGTMIREYIWLDDMPLAQVEASWAIYYIHPDHLNRPQKMTDTAQKVVWDNEQQPFGEPLPFTIGPLGFNAMKQFQMTVSGGINYSYVVQASTSLDKPNWVSLATNAWPSAFTDTNAAGYQARFYRVVYAPRIAAVTNNLRFPGQYFDAESGLNYNMMRDYDPTLGRYIQNDPNSLIAGMNLYVYTYENPITFFDPNGLLTLSIGLTLNWQLFAVGGYVSGGLVIDGHGNIGFYKTLGGGLGSGSIVSGGVSFAGSDAETICDVAGPFGNVSAGGGLGTGASVDAFTGDSPNGHVVGEGFTVGPTLGLGGLLGGSKTWVDPITKLW